MSDLRLIPGVGESIEKDLQNIGINQISDLKGKNPEDLYMRHNDVKGFTDDKCLLYVFRLAVYFANNEAHEAEKLKWWYWKDKN